MQSFGREQFGSIASHKRRFLDTQYGIRKDGDTFMISNSTLTVDSDRDIRIKGKHFNGKPGLWELLTRKNVKHEQITTNNLKSYKKILQMTNTHLTGR